MRHDLSRGRAALLLAVVAVAFLGFHLAKLPENPQYFIFRDALHYAQQARDLAEGGFPHYNRDWAPLPPPLYGVTLAPARLFAGADGFAWWSRFTNLLLLVSALLPAYRLARTGLPRTWAVAASALTLVAPFTVYSRLLLSENLAVPMFLWLSLAVTRAARQPGARRTITAGVVLGLCVLTKTLFVVTAPALVLAVAWGQRSIRSGLAAIGWAGLGAAAVVGAWSFRGLVFPAEAGLEAAFSYGAEFEHAGFQPLAIYRYWIRATSFCWVAGPGPIMLVLGLVALFTWALGRDPARRGLAAWLILAGAAVTGFVAIFLAQVAAWKPLIHERYLVYLWPLVTIMFVTSVHAARERRRAVVLVAVCVAVVLATWPPAKPLDPRIANVFEFPSFTQLTGLVAADGGTVLLRLLLVASLLLVPLLLRARRWGAIALLLLGAAYPAHATYRVFKEHVKFDRAKRAATMPVIDWLRSVVGPGDVIIHDASVGMLAYDVALRLEIRFWEVGEDLNPIWRSPVRFDLDTGRLAFPEPRPGGRALLLTRSTTLPTTNMVAGFRDLRLIRFEGGREGLLENPVLIDDEWELRGIFPDHWCSPHARLRGRTPRRGRYRCSIIVSLPADARLPGEQALRFRGSFGETPWEPIAPGETRTFSWSDRVEVPRFELTIEARHGLTRDGRVVAVRIEGLAIERIPSAEPRKRD